MKHRLSSSHRVRSAAWRCCLGIAGLSQITSLGLAADRSWINTAGGTFTTLANWRDGLFAGVNDAACFHNSSVFFPPGQTTYTVNFSANAQNQAVKVRNDFVTFNLSGRTYTTTQITGNEIGTVGGGGSILTARSARLTIQNGTFHFNAALTEQMLIGAVPGSLGSLAISTGGILTGSPNLLVGTASATGSLIINGGTATTAMVSLGSGAAGNGNAIITGPFASLTSTSLFVGNAGSGTMSMLVGAILQNNGTATIGNVAGSSGLVTVDTTGRWIQNGSLIVGNVGAGTVQILNGGQLTGASAILGSATASTGTARVGGPGSGSRWTNSGSLIVGGFGNATLNIDAGALVSAATTTIADRFPSTGVIDITGGSSFSGGATIVARASGSNGILNIDGTGSSATLTTLTVGNFGDGSMNVTGGALVRSTNGFVGVGPANNFEPIGTVTISGTNSRWINSGSLVVGGGGDFPEGGGALEIRNGGSVQNTDAFIALNPNSDGEVSVEGGTWNNSGHLFVGGNQFTDGGFAILNVGPAGVVNAGSITVSAFSTVNLAGGQINIGSAIFGSGDFNFDSGTFRFTGNAFLELGNVGRILGPTKTIVPQQHLVVSGTAQISGSVILGLDGGTFSVASLLGSSQLRFDSGTFNLTSDNLTIGAAGIFGASVTLDDRNINVTNATTIAPGARLTMLGGNFFSGAGITNNGEIIVNSPFTANFPNAIINNGEVRVSTGATANFIGNVTGAGSFSGGGTKFFIAGSNSSVGFIDSPGSTIVEAGATLAVARIRETSLTVNGNVNINPGGTDASTSRLNVLSIGSGRLDLANNALVIDYSGASPIPQISEFIQSGFAGGSWNGVGINSSIAASTANRALGFAEATDIGSPSTFAGQPIDSTTVLVQYTLPGDADLDRAVGIGDFALLAANFNLPSRWSRGDFNYDSITDIGDFALLAAHFNVSLPADLPRSAVPEPVSAMAVITVAGLMNRRRNCRPPRSCGRNSMSCLRPSERSLKISPFRNPLVKSHVTNCSPRTALGARRGISCQATRPRSDATCVLPGRRSGRYAVETKIHGSGCIKVCDSPSPARKPAEFTLEEWSEALVQNTAWTGPAFPCGKRGRSTQVQARIHSTYVRAREEREK